MNVGGRTTFEVCMYIDDQNRAPVLLETIADDIKLSFNLHPPSGDFCDVSCLAAQRFLVRFS